MRTGRLTMNKEEVIGLLDCALDVCYDAGDVDEAIGYIKEAIDRLESED